MLLFLDVGEIKNGVLSRLCHPNVPTRGGMRAGRCGEVRRDGRNDEGETARIKMPRF